MIKLTTLLIGCSLALTGAAMAQEPAADASPAHKQEAKGAHGKGASEAKQGGAAQEAKPQGNAAGAPAAANKHGAAPSAAQAPTSAASTANDAANTHGKSSKGNAPASSATAPAAAAGSAMTPNAGGAKGKGATNVATPAPTASTEQHGKGAVAAPKVAPSPAPAASAKPTATAKPTASATAAATPTPATKPMPSATASVAPTITPAATAAPSATAAATPAAATSPVAQTVPPPTAKRPEPQVVQEIRQQHQNFRAQPRPDRVPAVTFQSDYRIQGSDRWQGPQYEVYRSYHPERHDRNWYHSRYQRVELVGGGYYYWNNGYWYPAWGYSPQEEYYAYDAPIYVGQRAEPPDRVIADVQAALQKMGYYKGEVDGLLGPLTREALVGYQSDQGLTATAVIDEPTLAYLGMS